MRPDLFIATRHLTVLAELVADIGEPCWVSGATAAALHGFDGFDLRQPFHQVVLGRRRDKLIRVDFHFTGTPIVVEALGYKWHRSGMQLRIDAERTNTLLLAGYIPLQFTHSQVVDEADVVTSTIRSALERYSPRLL